MCERGFLQSFQGPITTGLRAPLSGPTVLAVDIGSGWTMKLEDVEGPEPYNVSKMKGKGVVRREYDRRHRSSCSKGSKLQIGMYLSYEGFTFLSQLK